MAAVPRGDVCSLRPAWVHTDPGRPALAARGGRKVRARLGLGSGTGTLVSVTSPCFRGGGGKARCEEGPPASGDACTLGASPGQDVQGSPTPPPSSIWSGPTLRTQVTVFGNKQRRRPYLLRGRRGPQRQGRPVQPSTPSLWVSDRVCGRSVTPESPPGDALSEPRGA